MSLTSTMTPPQSELNAEDIKGTYTVIDQEFKITNKQSAFYGEVFELEERVPWRDGTVSLWLKHPTLGTLSFPSTDCEFHNAIRREVPYPENYVVTRHDNGSPE